MRVGQLHARASPPLRGIDCVGRMPYSRNLPPGEGDGNGRALVRPLGRREAVMGDEHAGFFGPMVTAAGFGLFLTWIYCCFFSCALFPSDTVARASEVIWGTAMAMATIVSAAVALRAARGAVGALTARALPVSAILAAAGCAMVWVGTSDPYLFRLWQLLGGLLCGPFVGLGVVACGSLLARAEARATELLVVAGFSVAFVLYLALLLLKSPPTLVVIAALPACFCMGVEEMCARLGCGG